MRAAWGQGLATEAPTRRSSRRIAVPSPAAPVSRAVDEASVTKLIRAGASRAISPYAIGGHRLAHLILSPAVGKTLEALNVRRATGASILAVLRDGNPLVGPPVDFVLASGDRLLALGTGQQLRQLEALIAAAVGPRA